jgi:serpin B
MPPESAVIVVEGIKMIRRSFICIILIVSVVFIQHGCSGDTGTGPVGEDIEHTYTDIATRILRNNEFAVDLYKKVAEDEEGNFMISPHSTEVAFAMLYAGARGQTEIEIANVMHFNYPQENGFHDAMSMLNNELCGRDTDQFTIKIANGCWMDRGFSVLQSYQDSLYHYYGVEMDTLDFGGAPEDSRSLINDWVYEETDHWIEDAFPSGSITPMTVMVLANTFCFQAKWLNCFDPDYTYDGYFHLLDGSTVTVPIMHGEDMFETFDGDGYGAIRLPYEGEQVSMLIILPDEGNFESFEAELDASLLVSLYDSLETGFTHVKLPRFTISTDLELSRILYEMGMHSVFYPGADLSGIDGTDDGAPWVTSAIHKTEMWVNEHGTGAYAMTGMVLTVGIVPHFYAVRPFIFAIVDEPTGTIMFTGRVVEANGAPPPIILQE